MAPAWRSIDRDGMIRVARDLVSTPSFSAHEAEVAALTAEEMRGAGFEVVIDRMGNVIGRLGAGQGKKLVCDAHMDTVDVSCADSWQHPPFAGELERGVLFGRGACDMKGALAALVYAGKALADSEVRLDGDFYVVGVVQEEPCEGMAIGHVIENGLSPDWVILGEPTDLQVARGQRGRVELEVAIRGRSCHASAPDRGVNAVYEAARVIMSLELLAPQLVTDPFLGKGTIAVTDIRSTADSRNAVPDLCTLSIDRRLTISETESKALAELRRVLSREAAEATVTVPTSHHISYTGLESSVRQYFPYWMTPETEPLLTRTVSVIEDLLGFVPRVGKWDFSTDGVYTAGQASIPTVGFGPGEERFAHTIEDQIRVKDIESAAQVYAELAVRLLGSH